MNKATKMLYGVVVMTMALLVSACGGLADAASMAEEPMPDRARASRFGDIEAGRAIFHGEQKLPSVIPCSTCHFVKAHQGVRLGPNLAGISERAGERVEGQSDVEYLRDSIKYPDAYVVEDFPPGTMNQAYEDRLSEEQINNVIAYLLTL